MTAALPWRAVAGGVELAVRVTPRASRAALAGVVESGGPAGGPWLAARVTPPPEDGQASAPLLVLLADALGVAPSACAVVGGAAWRRKQVRVAGDSATLECRLAALQALLGRGGRG